MILAMAGGMEPEITPARKPLLRSSRRTAGSICVSSISRQAASSSTGSLEGKRAQTMFHRHAIGRGLRGLQRRVAFERDVTTWKELAAARKTCEQRERGAEMSGGFHQSRQPGRWTREESRDQTSRFQSFGTGREGYENTRA